MEEQGGSHPLSWPVLWLLVSCAIPLTASETVVFHNTVLNDQDVDASYTVARSCICRQLCATTNCSTYSLSAQSTTGFLCAVSLNPVPHYALNTAPKFTSYVVHKSDYKFYGSNFYMIFSLANELRKSRREPYDAKTRATTTALELARNKAMKHCLSEGGQLAVVPSDGTMAELRQAMGDVGVHQVWFGLYRETLNAEFTAFEIPNWTFNNGSKVETPRVVLLSDTNRCFNLDLKRAPVDHVNNVDVCPTVLPFACQRDY